MKIEEKALVKNASSEAQVKRAENKEKLLRERELEDLNYVMSSQQGRRLMWRLLGHCKVFESVFETSAKIHYNSGKQDVGHYIMSEIISAGSDLFLKMQNEAIKQKEIDNE